jgi:16S rRNA processing protein RimM
MVTIGRIVRPHGIRGEVVVLSETDFGNERFGPGQSVQALRNGAVVTMRIRSGREHDGRWLVGFEGVETRNDAEELRGIELRIPEDALKPLGEGAYYVHDLLGCRVALVNGEPVGEVTRVDLAVGLPMLVVTGVDGDEVLVPLAAAFCREVDVAGRRIVIDPPPGLVELNRKVRREAPGDDGR